MKLDNWIRTRKFLINTDNIVNVRFLETTDSRDVEVAFNTTHPQLAALTLRGDDARVFLDAFKELKIKELP